MPILNERCWPRKGDMSPCLSLGMIKVGAIMKCNRPIKMSGRSSREAGEEKIDGPQFPYSRSSPWASHLSIFLTTTTKSIVLSKVWSRRKGANALPRNPQKDPRRNATKDIMKWLILLPASAVAFQSVAPIRRSTTSLNYYPKKFDRAEQCATHYGTCNLDELEKLADGRW